MQDVRRHDKLFQLTRSRRDIERIVLTRDHLLGPQAFQLAKSGLNSLAPAKRTNSELRTCEPGP
jgi:hypothetical protein